MIIGIPIAFGDSVYKVNQAYVEYIRRAGHDTVLLSPMPRQHKKLQDQIESLKPYADTMACQLDGLLLPGGQDVDPIYFGHNNLACEGTNPTRDAHDIALVNAFLEQKKPILGICRGHQLLCLMMFPRNRVIWHQHIPMNAHTQTEKRLKRDIPSHRIKLYDHEETQEFIDEDYVNSFHHQAFEVERGFPQYFSKNAPHIKILATAPRTQDVKDKDVELIEAFYSPPLKVLSVQWHPEELYNSDSLLKIFRR